MTDSPSPRTETGRQEAGSTYTGCGHGRNEQLATAQSKDAIKSVNGEIGAGIAGDIPSL